MRKIFKRFASLLTIFILTIMSIVPVHASENTSVVNVTDDLAIQMAERFAKGIGENSNIVANNPRKFYDTTGQAIGYIVNYNLENKPYGYVVFDTTCESLISEYSFGNNSANPYEVIYQSEANVFSEKANTSEIYKIAPFEYGIVDNLGKIRTNYGETLEKTVLSLNESRGKDPATWDEVLLDIDEVYENYTLVSTNHLQEFISFNEPYIESVTGHYACAVSALLACGAYYNAVDYTDIAGDYMDIWDSTGTTVSSESGGITYGSTTIGNIGPGFVDFCAGKNVSVTQNTDYSPNYNFFTNCIDRGDIAVVHCGIISSDTELIAQNMKSRTYTKEEIDIIYRSALLHDIGKIAVPDAVLNKPSRLTDGEYELMKKHTIWGKEILAGLEFLPQADMGAAYHHERFDGKGYPYGLKGDKIPDIVRIISAADSLDAMSSNRCYRRHCDKDYIISEFEKGAGTQFDADVAQVVVELIKEGRIIL